MRPKNELTAQQRAEHARRCRECKAAKAAGNFVDRRRGDRPPGIPYIQYLATT